MTPEFNTYRRTGRTTRMMIEALASDKIKVAMLSPILPMAKYNMEFFIRLIENITEGKGKPKINYSKMTVEFYDKTFYFISADNERAMKEFRRETYSPEPIFDEFKDHTIFERGL